RRTWWRTRSSRSRALTAPRYRDRPGEGVRPRLLGYVVAHVGRHRWAPTARGEAVTDLVTVLVPARNEERSIGAALDSIVGQTYGRLQIVVVDDGSTDRTAEIVRARMGDDPRIELWPPRGRGIPAALNQGLEVARGTWLVRVDAHATIAPTYVSQLVDHLRDGGWGGVGGRKDGYGETAAGRAIAAAMGGRFGVGNSKYHYATGAGAGD